MTYREREVAGARSGGAVEGALSGGAVEGATAQEHVKVSTQSVETRSPTCGMCACDKSSDKSSMDRRAP